MTIVVGTAGHIDHGKTRLLRALTGIDADRLPEERRRGMTIDVGYAHLTLDDSSAIDFVDVPGHDRLVGNMLVGAGEIDAAMLVVAADDGPRAQTLEHLALLDALEIPIGIVVVTKVDAVAPERVDEVIDAVARRCSRRRRSPVRPSSPRPARHGTWSGRRPRSGGPLFAIDSCRADRPPTLAIDRAFSVKGRGAVVTGTLRGGPLTGRNDVATGSWRPRGADPRDPGARVERVDRVAGGGRAALNLGGIDAVELHRGMVLTADPDVVATDRSSSRSAGRRQIGRVAGSTSTPPRSTGPWAVAVETTSHWMTVELPASFG